LAAVGADEENAGALDENTMRNAVADKGYHSNDTLMLLDFVGIRSYISEPERGRRTWQGEGKEYARHCVYANRRRIRGGHGKALMRQRGEKVERTFAHIYETGAMRRTHLRHHDNILKRLLIHASGYNLSIVLRGQMGFGKPKPCKMPIKGQRQPFRLWLFLIGRPLCESSRFTMSSDQIGLLPNHGPAA